MNKSEIKALVENQREYFKIGASRNDLSGKMYRTNRLLDLKEAVQKYEKQLVEALYQDLGKCEFEAYATEMAMFYQELDQAFKYGNKWLSPKLVMPNKINIPAKAHIYAEPKGTVLIMAPWNYPVLLSLAPLVPALLAGNTVVLKPSEKAPATAKVIEEMLNGAFKKEDLYVVTGGVETGEALLEQKFDHIFFTGNKEVGKKVLHAAAENYATVTLELGGKSPCVVANSAITFKAAKRIMWGKLVNAGQTCIAPDYVLVQEENREQLVSALEYWAKEFYNGDPIECEQYGGIVNEEHYDRLMALIEPYQGTKKLIYGGKGDRENLKIQPTILVDVDLNDPVMQEEIFGPILPVLTYDSMNTAIDFINDNPKPLAAYLFSEKTEVDHLFATKVEAGGICINDTLSHTTNPALPFGGKGESGMGSYHGYYGFLEFSNKKSVMQSSIKTDNDLKYPPFNSAKLDKLKKVFKMFGPKEAKNPDLV